MTNATLARPDVAAVDAPLTIDAVAELTEYEQRTKRRCDLIVNRGKRHFLRVGRALYRLNHMRLYRNEAPTFEAYVKAQFGFSRSRAYQLISASLLSTQVEVQNERQARELSRIAPELQPAAWEMAKHLAEQVAPGQIIPTRFVRAAINVLDTAQATGGYVDTGTGEMEAMDAAVTQETFEIAQRQREHIRTSWERRNDLNADPLRRAVAHVMSSYGSTVTLDFDDALVAETLGRTHCAVLVTVVLVTQEGKQ